MKIRVDFVADIQDEAGYGESIVTVSDVDVRRVTSEAEEYLNLWLLHRVYDCFGEHLDLVGIFTSEDDAKRMLPDAHKLNDGTRSLEPDDYTITHWRISK